MYFKYTFVKDPAMKGMIISKADEEAGNNSAVFISETKKIMKSYGGGGNQTE